MQQLSGLDASFLALETATTTGHVGGLSVLDPSDAPEPLTLARLTEVMAERLPLVPVLRRKLLNVPFGLDQPYWVDDADFDIEYHVREIALPGPGSDAQLDEQARDEDLPLVAGRQARRRLHHHVQQRTEQREVEQRLGESDHHPDRVAQAQPHRPTEHDPGLPQEVHHRLR